MQSSPRKIRNILFFALVIVFAIVVSIFTGLGIRELADWELIFQASALVVLGIALFIVAKRTEDRKKSKVFFMMTGASAAGIPIFAILHNVVYGVSDIIWANGL